MESKEVQQDRVIKRLNSWINMLEREKKRHLKEIQVLKEDKEALERDYKECVSKLVQETEKKNELTEQLEVARTEVKIAAILAIGALIVWAVTLVIAIEAIP